MTSPSISICAVLLLPLGTLCAPAPLRKDSAQVSDAFAEHWYDGHAELSGYEYTVRRYGEPRAGQAVAIYVTEPFSASRHVKLDDPQAAGDDAFTALKLNLARDFQTGIYDYDTMLSVFARVDDLAPVKTSFTSQEWCGQVYEQLDARGDGWQHVVHSYFEGESVDETLQRPDGGLLEDELFLHLRGLHGAPLEAGEARDVPILEGAFVRRLEHRAAVWQDGRIERSAAAVSVKIPAGTFDALRYTVRIGSRTGRFDVERDAPHRLLAWRWEQDGQLQEEARLQGTERLRYWQLNAEGDASHLEPLGLEPPR